MSPEFLRNRCFVQVTFGNHIEQWTAIEEPRDVLLSELAHSGRKGRAVIATRNVRRHNDVGKLPERVIRGHGILVMRIQRRTGDPAFTEGLEQGLFLNDWSASRIQDERSSRQSPKLGLANQAG